MNLVRDAEHRVRSGWVVLVFIISATLVQGGLNVVLAITGLSRFETLGSPAVMFATMTTLVGAGAATAFTWALFRVPIGLADSQRGKHFAIGAALGGLALTVACVGPVLAGATTLTFNSDGAVFTAGIVQLVTLAPAGLGEELLLRGLGFQALRRGLGDVTAVIVSSAVFGALHLFNPHASLVAALLITLVGIWFGTIMVKSGSVWMPMGLHVAWNFFEGFVFGQPVSGNAPGVSLLVAGPATVGFWSGGDFGPEAAGWTAVVLSVAVIVTLRWRPRA